MVNIKTERLREKADAMNREALHYNYRFQTIEECISWIKNQEFDEKEELQRVLARQYEELREQKREILLLSGVMQRICDKYDETEQRIMEDRDIYRKFIGYVKMVDLVQMRDELSLLGIHVTDK